MSAMVDRELGYLRDRCHSNVATLTKQIRQSIDKRAAMEAQEAEWGQELAENEATIEQCDALLANAAARRETDRP